MRSGGEAEQHGRPAPRRPPNPHPGQSATLAPKAPLGAAWGSGARSVGLPRQGCRLCARRRRLRAGPLRWRGRVQAGLCRRGGRIRAGLCRRGGRIRAGLCRRRSGVRVGLCRRGRLRGELCRCRRGRLRGRRGRCHRRRARPEGSRGARRGRLRSPGHPGVSSWPATGAGWFGRGGRARWPDRPVGWGWRIRGAECLKQHLRATLAASRIVARQLLAVGRPRWWRHQLQRIKHGATATHRPRIRFRADAGTDHDAGSQRQAGGRHTGHEPVVGRRGMSRAATTPSGSANATETGHGSRCSVTHVDPDS
jgi:hypothetical protein